VGEGVRENRAEGSMKSAVGSCGLCEQEKASKVDE